MQKRKRRSSCQISRREARLDDARPVTPRRAAPPPRWFETARRAAPAPRTRSGTPPRWFSWASSPVRRDSSTRAVGAFCASTWWCTASTGTSRRAPSAARRRRRRPRATAGNSRRGATRSSSPSTPRAYRYVTRERRRWARTRHTPDGRWHPDRRTVRWSRGAFFLGVFVFVSFLASRRASRVREQRARPPPKQNTNDT